MTPIQVFKPGRTPVSSSGKTIREKILDQIELLAKEMSESGSPLWLNVFKGDTSEFGNETAPFIGIEEGEEVIIEMYGGQTIKELPIIFTFRWPGGKGMDAAAAYKYYLGKIQTVYLPIHEDDTQYPYVRDMREDSNNPAYLTIEDTFPGGSVVFVLQYDHARNDPYKLAGEA